MVSRKRMAGPVDKLAPNDPRVQQKTATLNGRTHGYLLGEPKGTKQGTIFLIHGFPDSSYGWRCQIPMLMELGLRVVVPDMIGYARTDAPEELEAYTYKQVADDMNELAKQLGEPQIILGGHDWGGAVVYRVALHYPKLITHIISICTPFNAPSPKYYDLETVIKVAPRFGYQAHFASGEIEKNIPATSEGVRRFLVALHGGKTEAGWAFNPFKGIDFDILNALDTSKSGPWLTQEDLDHMVSLYMTPKSTTSGSKHPLRGPLNWYRTRALNHEYDQLILNQPLTQPVLFIHASQDTVLTKDLAAKMPELISDLEMTSVDTHHWAMLEAPAPVNGFMSEWIERKVLGKSRL